MSLFDVALSRMSCAVSMRCPAGPQQDSYEFSSDVLLVFDPSLGLATWMFYLLVISQFNFCAPGRDSSWQAAPAVSLPVFLSCPPSANASAAPTVHDAGSAASRGGSTFPPPGHLKSSASIGPHVGRSMRPSGSCVTRQGVATL